MEQALLRISGKVQGVWYRASAQEMARSLNLTGYAKNLPDGSVLSVVQGPRDSIEDFITWAHEGPENAEVKHIEVSWEKPEEEFEGFAVE